MKDTITYIEGVRFVAGDGHTLNHAGDNFNVEVSQQDKDSWDVYIHDKDTDEIMNQSTHGSKEECVKWAKENGYVEDEE